MVGGGGGVSGPKELMGWVDAVTDGRAYPHPAPRSAEVEELVFYNMSNVRCNLRIKVNSTVFISRLYRSCSPDYRQFYETICKSNLR